MQQNLKNMNKDYKGTIIEESLEDNIVLNDFNIIGFKITDDVIFSERWHSYFHYRHRTSIVNYFFRHTQSIVSIRFKTKQNFSFVFFVHFQIPFFFVNGVSGKNNKRPFRHRIQSSGVSHFLVL